jgi:pimeloyl-ACP methyl ester carboxylesterase/DNA-binding CsgD family transcriptional regulator
MGAPPVKYVTTSDGASIAYVVTGAGRPLVLMFPSHSHIEISWSPPSPMLPWLEELAKHFQLVQFDSRGHGMSSRGLGPALSMVDLRADLAAVADRLRLDRFVLLAFDWKGHVAVEYAIENPKRVSALVLNTCSIDNEAWSPVIYDALATQDWEAFLREMVSAGQAPDVAASLQRMRQFQSQSDYLAFARVMRESNLEEVLPQLQAPTLVLHPRDHFRLPVQEGMKLAARIPNARIVLIDGASWGDADQGIKAIESFLADIVPDEDTRRPVFGGSTAGGVPAGLSAREADVLRLIAAGKSNQQIADELVISLNTVLRHVSNIFAKTGAANRTEAAGYARNRSLI